MAQGHPVSIPGDDPGFVVPVSLLFCKVPVKIPVLAAA